MINRAKSAIMELRMDNRTPSRLLKEHLGYPIVHKYLYLGILIDEWGTLKEETAQFKSKEKQLSRLMGMTWAKKLPGHLRFDAWR